MSDALKPGGGKGDQKFCDIVMARITSYPEVREAVCKDLSKPLQKTALIIMLKML